VPTLAPTPAPTVQGNISLALPNAAAAKKLIEEPGTKIAMAKTIARNIPGVSASMVMITNILLESTGSRRLDNHEAVSVRVEYEILLPETYPPTTMQFNIDAIDSTRFKDDLNVELADASVVGVQVTSASIASPKIIVFTTTTTRGRDNIFQSDEVDNAISLVNDFRRLTVMIALSLILIP